MPYLGVAPNPRENREVDDISSGFNGGTTQFTLQSGGSNVSPGKDTAIIVSLGGVVQNPGTDYTIAASTITFTTAPASGLSFFGVVLAQSIDIETVADNTVTTAKIVNDAVTADKLAHTSVTAGSYTTADITVDAQGRITAAASGTISGAEIADQAVTNAKVNNSAAIAGTKISPDFGSQAISTTGNVTIGDSIIHSGDTDTKIRFDTNDRFKIETAGVERVAFGGVTTFNESGADCNFRIEGDTDENLFFLDAGNNRVGIGTNNPNGKFVVASETSKTNSVEHLLIMTHTSTGTTTTGFGTGIRFQGERNNGALQTIGDINLEADVNSGTNISAAVVFKPSTSGTVTERMRIDSGGRVGIGTSSPGSYNANSDNFVIRSSGSTGMTISGSTGGDCQLGFSNGEDNGLEGILTYQHGSNEFLLAGIESDSSIAFRTGNDKRMIINSNGNIFLDSTFDTTANNARKSYFTNTGQQYHGRNANEHYIVFQDVSNNQIGGIVRGSGSSVAYNTSSDYRLKENISGISDGITRLKQLKPSRFNFKSEPSITIDGFIAHEVSSIVPEAIEGEKDGVITQAMLDAGTLEGTVGDPIYQGIDQSKLIPLLTAALQEEVAKREALEARVAALEAA